MLGPGCGPPVTRLLLLFQYQIDTELLSETLSKLNNTLEPKAAGQKSNPEMLLQLEVPSESRLKTPPLSGRRTGKGKLGTSTPPHTHVDIRSVQAPVCQVRFFSLL